MQFSWTGHSPLVRSAASGLRPSKSPNGAILHRSDSLQRAARRPYVANSPTPERIRMAARSSLYHHARHVRSSLYQVNIWIN
jgi:hypothetical protein